MLQQRLAAEMSPDQVAELHRRASIWFQEQGLVEEALQHTLAAGDLDLAAHQMAAALREVINREDRPTLERWLRSLPEEMIERRPEMLMVRAWALEFSWQLNRQAHVLRQIEGLLDSDAGRLLPAEDLQILRGQILPLRAQAAYFANQPTQAIGLCQEALALLPSSWTFCRGGTMMYLGMALQASGESRAADRLLLDEYQSCSDKSGTYAALVLRALCFNHLNAGRLEQARRVARALLEGATQSGVAIMLSWAHWFLGIVCFERNDLETAAHHFQKIADDRYSAQITAYRDAVAGLALIHQIHGEATQARQLVESVSQFDLEVRGKEADRTHSLRARLRLLEGDLEEARRWAEAFSGPPPDQPFLWLEEPQVTRARVLAASGGEADLRLALELLDSLEDIADRTHNTRYKIHLLALRAVALDTHGQIHEAQKALSQAVTMARPGGFLRVYLELGERMLQMLGRLAAQGDSTETIGGILGAFEGGEHRPMASKGLAQPNRQASPAASPLPEPLTPRELEVLSLLRGPQSVKEIALQLHISPATAKRHIANVYGKLDVKQRWQAVARAEELHILSPR
jgi:LuxR family maltose regulon positive regulatory protein